ncbi:MAG: hypothetical protein ACOYB3_00245 [Azonexus sp.]
MNLISKVLFGTQGRYWYTLLTSVVSNLELYKGFSIRLYIASDVRSHPISSILDELSDKLPMQVFEIPGAYTATEPSMWRLRPLWEPVDMLLCRDVDSVPTTEEVQAVRLWQTTQYPIHSIRSFHLHDTLIMAGLCGFRPGDLPFVTQQVPTFDRYVELYKQHSSQCPGFVWGCDQEALRMLFSNLRPYIFDCPIGNCGPHNEALGIPTAPKETTYKISVSDLNADLLRICDGIMAEPWGDFKGFAGRPIGNTRPQLVEILKLDLPSCAVVRSILDNNSDYKSFYTP